MKKFTYYQFSFLIAVFTVVLLACDNPTDDKIYSSVIGGGGHKKEVKLSENDQQLLVEAYTLGQFKLSLANEAQIRSASAESVQLGKAVSVFNANLNSRIEKIADEHGLNLPMDLTDEQKLIWKQLVKEKGWNFDKKFSELLEKIKARETGFYNEATPTISDKNVRLLIQQAIPELQPHQSLHEKLCQKIQEKHIRTVADEDDKDNALVRKKSTASKS